MIPTRSCCHPFAFTVVLSTVAACLEFSQVASLAEPPAPAPVVMPLPAPEPPAPTPVPVATRRLQDEPEAGHPAPPPPRTSIFETAATPVIQRVQRIFPRRNCYPAPRHRHIRSHRNC